MADAGPTSTHSVEVGHYSSARGYGCGNSVGNYYLSLTQDFGEILRGDFDGLAVEGL